MQFSPSRYESSSNYAYENRPKETHIPESSLGAWADFSSEHLTIGGGVAIFHIKSEKVVLCYHTRDKYWFLPKGRRDAGEDGAKGAEREGYEESGYRNRLLPLPINHSQPSAHAPDPNTPPSPFLIEPVWTQMMPVRRDRQYILHWYIAETLPPKIQEELDVKDAAALGAENAPTDAINGTVRAPYLYPPPYPARLTIEERLKLEPEGYTPPKHENTGVDEEEAQYHSELLPVNKAIKVLGRTVSADVVRRGWEYIRVRKEMEENGYKKVLYGGGKVTLS